MRIRAQWMLLPAALLLVVLLAFVPGSSALCEDPSPLHTGDVIHIAVLVWVDAPHGLFTGNLSATTPSSNKIADSFVQPHLLGVELYINAMRARGGVLPLPNGESVKLNFVYINLANSPLPYGLPNPDGSGIIPPSWSHWNYELTYQDVPYFIYLSQHPSIPGSVAYAGDRFFNFPPGIFYRIISKDPAVLAEFGVDKAFTFIVPSIMTLEITTAAMANLVEPELSHILVHPLMAAQELFVCDGLPYNISLTPDCLDPALGRQRRGGARRFETLVSTLPDSSGSQLAALESFHTLGVKSILIIRDAAQLDMTFSLHAAKLTRDAALQLNIAVLDVIVMEDASDFCPGKLRNCPPLDRSQGQSQVFPNGWLPTEAAAYVAGLNPDALIVLASTVSFSAYAIGRMFHSLQHDLNWSPKAVSWGGGIDGLIPNWMPNGEKDMLWTWNAKPWDPKLHGPSYANFPSPTNFELHPAEPATETTEELHGPAVFKREFLKAYGEHPFNPAPLEGNSIPALGYASLVLVQKMIEAGQSSDVATLLAAGRGMSSPSMVGAMSIDTHGRLTRVNEVLQQATPTGMRLLTPWNIGSPPEFPYPEWNERVFKPEFYSLPSEQLLLALTGVTLLILLVLLVLVLRNYRAPVIRAATPSFCVVSLGGAMLMALSNFVATSVVNDAHCGAQVWLLSLGFTCLFAPLFVKTFRVWRIFGTKRLQVVKLRDADLLMAVGVFAMIDVLINAIWMGVAGLRAEEVTVDPVRPSYNYLQCNWSDGTGYVYAHVVLKGALLLCGAVLAYAVRNVPSAFNESSLIALAIYNTTFIIAFIVPILAVGLGGRITGMLLRGYVILFVAVSTAALLYLPKLILLRKSAAARYVNNSTRKDQTQQDKSSGGTAEPPLGGKPLSGAGNSGGKPLSGAGNSGGSKPLSGEGPVSPNTNTSRSPQLNAGRSQRNSGALSPAGARAEHSAAHDIEAPVPMSQKGGAWAVPISPSAGGGAPRHTLAIRASSSSANPPDKLAVGARAGAASPIGGLSSTYNPLHPQGSATMGLEPSTNPLSPSNVQFASRTGSGGALATPVPVAPAAAADSAAAAAADDAVVRVHIDAPSDGAEPAPAWGLPGMPNDAVVPL